MGQKGALMKADVIKVFLSMHKGVGESEVNKLVDDIDKDHNGEVSFEEFVNAFKTLPNHQLSTDFDLVELFTGEFIALLYSRIGVLVNASDELHFRPSSFSSTSSSSSWNVGKIRSLVKFGCIYNDKRVYSDLYGSRDTLFKFADTLKICTLMQLETEIFLKLE